MVLTEPLQKYTKKRVKLKLFQLSGSNPLKAILTSGQRDTKKKGIWKNPWEKNLCKKRPSKCIQYICNTTCHMVYILYTLSYILVVPLPSSHFLFTLFLNSLRLIHKYIIRPKAVNSLEGLVSHMITDDLAWLCVQTEKETNQY